MTVTEAWAGGYEVWRPDRRVLKALPREALAPFEVDGLTWLRPVDGEAVAYLRTRVDVLQALEELFECVTPHEKWLQARAAKNRLQHARAGGRPAYRPQEGRRLAAQETRRRQKFDRALKAWAGAYGLLGVGNGHQGDYVPDIFRAVKALRAWAVPESEIWFAPPGMGELVEASVTPEYEATGWPPPIWMGKGPTPDWELRVNTQAQLCTRPFGSDVWVAPSLWAAMCHVVRNADMLGLRFAMCAAEDCFNPFLAYGKRKHCSRKCANRAGEQERRRVKILSE